YMEAALALDQETNLGLRRFEVCDNIDLEMVLMEYESYHYVKYQKYPKLIRKVTEAELTKMSLYFTCINSLTNIFLCLFFYRNTCSVPKPLPKITSSQHPSSGKKTAASAQPNVRQIRIQFTFCFIYLAFKTAFNLCFQFADFNSFYIKNSDGARTHHAVCRAGPAPHMSRERLLKPLNGFSGITEEMRELATIISRDIYLHSPNVRWEDIIGLEDAKRLVKEAVVYPIKYPQLFTGILSPWKSLLLYGPPGTGKTMLAKAVATECKTTFFNISASSIISKWRGDSEKLVRVLFDLARYHAPSTIFLDELESVMGQRGSTMGELDHAMLRRLEKRILVGFPSSLARQAMVSHWLPPFRSTEGGVELRTQLDYQTLAKEMEGYSGSDIALVCKEASMRPVRKIFDALESIHNGDTDTPAICLDTVTTADFMEVLAHIKPSARSLMDRYTAWEKEYKSV
ncbi:hypothetical protein NQD34_009115, partial [Periophthalmus magnuspinnatus]